MSNKITDKSPHFFIKESIFGLKRDQTLMRMALKQACKAAERDEVPVGAIVVDKQGSIIGRGYNKVESFNSQVAHAEVHALLKATKRKKNWRLTGCWLYVTLEPCVMCIGLIVNSRMAGVVYGAASPLFGYNLDNHIASWVYKKNDFCVVAGIEARQSIVLLKDFFNKKREKK